MVRLDFRPHASPGRALRVALAPAPGVTVLAEPGPRLPFRDHAIDEVFMGGMIAWRGDIAETLDELWRICKPGALIHLTLPHASSVVALSRDPRPRPLLTLNTFNFYDPRTKPWDAPTTAFSVERARLRVAGVRAADSGLALARGPFARFIEGVANGSRGSQYRFERWFSGIVGFEEFDVVLSVVKPADIARTAPHSAGSAVGSNGAGEDARSRA
jgi:SAM-dependent methyltransferase